MSLFEDKTELYMMMEVRYFASASPEIASIIKPFFDNFSYFFLNFSSLLFQLMDCDLHQIIQSKQSLSDMHHKCFAKQMLEGIKAMHDIGVFREFHL